MAILQQLRKRQRHVILPLLFAVVFGYFAYHMMEGGRGVFAFRHLREEVGKAEETLTEVGATRKTWERRVALLRSQSLDPDMLDERARALLNVGKPDEVMIVIPTR
ncbi:MAG TPA: septum formation initiator family protein [Roseiflexaceae bacterium]|nr:septum formation initiator family protein [Roseiflexaceae bacterium]